jgi:hypothetical protein
MQLLISCRGGMWLGGLVATLHIGSMPRFQVPLPFTVYRSAFGVRRSAFGVWRLAFHIVLVVVLPTSPRRLKLRKAMSGKLSSKPWHCPCDVRFAQRLEGSRFTPLQVLAERAEETNPELPDSAASRRLPRTSPA